MEHPRRLGLTCLVVVVLLVPASAANATTVTGPFGETTPVLSAPSEQKAVPGTNKVVIHNSIANIVCSSEIGGFVSQHGKGVTANGSLALWFGNCTNGWSVTVPLNGSWEIHHTSGVNGTLTSSGALISANKMGINCTYETSNTDIGSITGGTPGTIHVAAQIPRVGGSFLCGGSSAAWTGAYKTTGTFEIDS